MAEVLLISGRLDESQEVCQRMAKDDPQFPPVYYWLGRVAAAKGQIATSIEHYRKACQLWPSFGTAHYALALACERTGKTVEARQHMAAYQKYKADRDRNRRIPYWKRSIAG
jgi:Flp pilus assembly protein TadD